MQHIEHEDVIFNDVLAYIHEQCGMLGTPRELIASQALKDSRDAAIAMLREAVAEIVYQDDREGA